MYIYIYIHLFVYVHIIPWWTHKPALRGSAVPRQLWHLLVLWLLWPCCESTKARRPGTVHRSHGMSRDIFGFRSSHFVWFFVVVLGIDFHFLVNQCSSSLIFKGCRPCRRPRKNGQLTSLFSDSVDSALPRYDHL